MNLQQPDILSRSLSQAMQQRQATISQLFASPVRLLAPMEGLTDPLMRQILTQIATD